MPSKPLHPCRAVGCLRLVSGAYCPDHASMAKRTDHRGSASERGYTWAWHKASESYKHRHPLCEVCRLEGRITTTAIAHHLVAVSTGGDVMVEDSELLPVCTSCHQRVEGLGREWRKAVRQPEPLGEVSKPPEK